MPEVPEWIGGGQGLASQLGDGDGFAAIGEHPVNRPNCGLSDALALAVNIRLAFEKVTYEHAKNQTVSIGVVQAKAGESADALYNRVDKALYTAKANGKNQVVTLD